MEEAQREEASGGGRALLTNGHGQFLRFDFVLALQWQSWQMGNNDQRSLAVKYMSAEDKASWKRWVGRKRAEPALLCTSGHPFNVRLSKANARG